MVWNPSWVECFSSQKTTLIDFLHVAKQNKSQLQCSTSSGMLWLASLTADTQDTMAITATSISMTPEVRVGRPHTSLVFEWLHPFILPSDAKNCCMAFSYFTWWHTLNRQYSSQALSHTLYTLHLDKGASRLLLYDNLIWTGKLNAWVRQFTTLAPDLTFSHSLPASTLLATHSREQDRASHGPPGPVPPAWSSWKIF